MKAVRENTMNAIGFTLHYVEAPKPLSAFIIEYGEKLFWVWMPIVMIIIVSNIFI